IAPQGSGNNTREGARLNFYWFAQRTKPSQIIQVKTEVVVVDDGSQDNLVAKVLKSVARAAAMLPRALTRVFHCVPWLKLLNRWKLVVLSHNVGPGAARNFGVRESNGDVLFF